MAVNCRKRENKEKVVNFTLFSRNFGAFFEFLFFIIPNLGILNCYQSFFDVNFICFFHRLICIYSVKNLPLG